VELAYAGEPITLSPDGGHSNQNQINEALEKGDVYLGAGVYEVDNTIIIGSDRVLSGDPNAITRVWSGSSKWFTGATGVISCKEPVQNVEICGFQMDGNIGNLPKGYADSRSDTDHDCEKLIILKGYSNQFANNIKVHDMKLYNSFSDGFYIIFGDHVSFYNNIVSNCQHEGFYFSCVKNGLAYGNKIAGITSDAGRLDNCVDCKVYDNLFFSYNGESYGAYKGGQAGLQIADAGSSHGYDASKKAQTTTNIEVYNNTFADPGRKAIWLDSTGKGVTNVYIHDNDFVDAAGLETLGIPVGGISESNPPTLEMSEKVFSSIFDILDVDFTEFGITNQTGDDIQYSVQTTAAGRIAGGIEIIGFNNTINIDGISYIPNETSVLVKYTAIKNPDYSWNNTGVKQIDKYVNVKIENGTAYATLKVIMRWYKITHDSLGKSRKTYKSTTAIFKDSEPSPKILQRSTNLNGTITQYPTYFLIYVPPGDLTKITYEYENNATEHFHLIGEQIKTSDGIKYTNFTRVDCWKGDISHYGRFVHINGIFDPSKLTITAYTPYESFNIERVYVIKKEVPSSIVSDWVYPSVGVLLILGYGARYYFRKIWY